MKSADNVIVFVKIWCSFHEVPNVRVYMSLFSLDFLSSLLKNKQLTLQTEILLIIRPLLLKSCILVVWRFSKKPVFYSTATVCISCRDAWHKIDPLVKTTLILNDVEKHNEKELITLSEIWNFIEWMACFLCFTLFWWDFRNI